MRTLNFGLRVADLEDRSRSTPPWGSRSSEVCPRRLGPPDHAPTPGDEFVTIELVHDPKQGKPDINTGLSHFVIKVESIDASVAALAARGYRRR